jgi:hypothetical protein
VDETSGLGVSTVSSYFWIFWAVAIPLTALTFVGFVLWWRCEKRRYDLDVERQLQISENWFEVGEPRSLRLSTHTSSMEVPL